MYKKVFIFLVIISLIFTISLQAEESKWGEISTEDWEELYSKDCGYDSPQELLSKVDNSVTNISQFLNRTKWYEDYPFRDDNKISLCSTNKKSRVSSTELVVYIRVAFFKRGFAPLTHELTHVIAGNSNMLSFSEGLADYMDEKYGDNISMFNFGAPIHNLVKKIINNDDNELVNKISKNITPANFNNFYERRNYYLLSHSFVKYLIESYGINKFMEVYDENIVSLACKEVYNKNLGELKNEWLKFLEGIEPLKYTYKEWVIKKVGKEDAYPFIKH